MGEDIAALRSALNGIAPMLDRLEKAEAAVERIKALRDEFAAEDHPTSTIISREIQGALDGER